MYYDVHSMHAHVSYVNEIYILNILVVKVYIHTNIKMIFPDSDNPIHLHDTAVSVDKIHEYFFKVYKHINICCLTVLTMCSTPGRSYVIMILTPEILARVLAYKVTSSNMFFTVSPRYVDVVSIDKSSFKKRYFVLFAAWFIVLLETMGPVPAIIVNGVIMMSSSLMSAAEAMYMPQIDEQVTDNNLPDHYISWLLLLLLTNNVIVNIILTVLLLVGLVIGSMMVTTTNRKID